MKFVAVQKEVYNKKNFGTPMHKSNYIYVPRGLGLRHGVVEVEG